MKHLKAKQIAVVMAAMLGTVGAVETASADVLATSIIELNGLMFTDEDGNQFTQDNEITIISAVNSSNGTNATLNKVSETMADVNVNAPGSIDLPTIAPNGTFSHTDVFDGNPDLCVGTACSSQIDNSFTNTIASSTTGDPSSDLAFSDELLTGAAVIFPGATAGATVSVESTSMLTGNGSGAALTENGLIADFEFKVGEDTKFFIDFNASAYMEAYVSTDVTAPDDTGNAFATRSISFKLTDNFGNVLLEWSPDGNGAIAAGVSVFDSFNLNTSLSRSEISNGAVAEGGIGVIESGRFFAGTEAILVAGDLYHLTASQKVSVNAKQNVPEPSVIALLGMGLLGFAFKKRKV